MKGLSPSTLGLAHFSRLDIILYTGVPFERDADKVCVCMVVGSRSVNSTEKFLVGEFITTSGENTSERNEKQRASIVVLASTVSVDE